jgi:hypothetical protein
MAIVNAKPLMPRFLEMYQVEGIVQDPERVNRLCPGPPIVCLALRFASTHGYFVISACAFL